MHPAPDHFILRVSCPAVSGIVAAVTTAAVHSDRMVTDAIATTTRLAIPLDRRTAALMTWSWPRSPRRHAHGVHVTARQRSGGELPESAHRCGALCARRHVASDFHSWAGQSASFHEEALVLAAERGSYLIKAQAAERQSPQPVLGAAAKAELGANGILALD